MRGFKVSVQHSFILTGILSGLTIGLAGAGIATAQQTPSYAAQSGASAQVQVPGNPNPDLTYQEVARMDQFLDDHKDIDKDLKQRPTLINDKKYLDHHKDLGAFLQAHPQIREEFSENPRYFMNREQRFDARENANQGIGRPRNPNPDLTTAEVKNFDGFLDAHPEIDRQLSANPSLINDPNYLRSNPQLQTYLNDHPQVRSEITETPNYFMRREQRFDARENGNAGAGVGMRNPNPDLTTVEVRNFDGFLDSHPDIDRQLSANPSLINDQNYLRANPQLQTYLTSHPQVREEITETPNYFMRREQRFDAREDNRLGANAQGGEQEEQERARQSARLNQYLSDHKDVDKDLQRNPALVNDTSYLKKHRDLDEFLRTNPDVSVAVKANPSFLASRDRDRLEMNSGANARIGATAGANTQLSKEQAERMDRFLDKHQGVAKDLDREPRLVNDNKYVEHHKDLREFLNKNPDMKAPLAEHHEYFEERRERFDAHTKRTPDAKTPTTPPAATSSTTTSTTTTTPVATPATQPTATTPPKTQVDADAKAKSHAKKPDKPVDKPVDDRQNMTPATTH